MGMFDTVHVTCPNCREVVEIQSKAGSCDLKNYSQSSVPIEIAASLVWSTEDEPETCTECGKQFKITTTAPRRVALDTHSLEPGVGYD